MEDHSNCHAESYFKKVYGTNNNPVTKAANSTGREATLVPSQAAEKKSSDNYSTLFIKYLSKRFAGYQILYKTHERHFSRPKPI